MEDRSPIWYICLIVFIGTLVISFLRPELYGLPFWGLLISVGGFVWIAKRGRKERGNEKQELQKARIAAKQER